jgi:hypothetical protein
MTKQFASRWIVVAVSAIVLFSRVTPAHAQVRGLYAPGMTATNSGVLPEPGLTYQNLFLLYTFDQLKGPNGTPLPINLAASVFADANIFVWVSKKKVLNGSYAAMAFLPFANSSLSTVAFGALAGGAGFGDSYYSPLTLGWKLSRADVEAGYGVFAPTGRFQAGASDNVGVGYWANLLTAGETVYLLKNKTLNFSSFQVYEFHTTQRETDIHPGQTFDIDYSLMQTVPWTSEMHTLLQVGIVGYGQYQTTDKSGPAVNPVTASNTRYVVNGLGGGLNIILPARKASVGVKYFTEFENSATVQGHSLQISMALTF